MYSKQLADHYDRLMGDDHTVHEPIRKALVANISPGAKVLELGCGTGTMLSLLKDDYQLYGMDNSKDMLEVAKKKVPRAKYYHQTIAGFELRERFDAIICVFDTINHLDSFNEWQAMFKSVYEHLSPGGIFIFDMNTVRRLEAFAHRPAFVQKISSSEILCFRAKKTKENKYILTFQLFEDIDKEKIKYFDEDIEEVAVEKSEVKKALARYFKTKKMIDPFRSRITTKTGRIIFVCKRK